jgi:hypothetical protein
VRWISAGMQAFAAAVTDAGCLFTWGQNTHGELVRAVAAHGGFGGFGGDSAKHWEQGLGNTVAESAPRPVPFFSDGRQVARARCGFNHMACVLGARLEPCVAIGG